ncbi:hypothetical protein TWF281_006501 [Arthrobotrys megalospora]
MERSEYEHNDEAPLSAVEQDEEALAAAVENSPIPATRREASLTKCRFLHALTWAYLMGEGRSHRSKVHEFWARGYEDVAHPSFKLSGVPHTWTPERVYKLETESFSWGRAGVTCFQWRGLKTLLEGRDGMAQDLTGGYQRCTVENVVRGDNQNTCLYDVVLSTKDRLFVVCGSNRPQDACLTQDPAATTPRGVTRTPWAWSDVMYGIWYNRVFPRGRYMLLQQNGSRRLRGLKYIAILGLDHPRALNIIYECFHQLGLNPESDALVVGHVDNGMRAKVFDILTMAPGIHGMHHMVFEHGNGLCHRFFRQIAIQWPDQSELHAQKAYPNVVITLDILAALAMGLDED